ncbi:hypothetical protein [Streptomyces sp. NPDC004528]|uniref:hypothetical protein n=1 Tax=Streptomyces sp. NPDC004528 TaxID=3154550 RepID=UPI0033A6957D
MVDPISVGASSLAKAASSALTKQLQSKAGVRLGSRDERRQVYARFQDAVTEAYTVMTVALVEQRLYSVWLGKKVRTQLTFQPRAAQKAAVGSLAAMRQSQSDLLRAYLDLRLVANPEPLRAADVVLDRFGELEALRVGASDEEIGGATNRIVEAQREFTDVCRDDLWYLPTRWQFYRRAWWTARRWRKRTPA